jgi:hypothetical protein
MLSPTIFSPPARIATTWISSTGGVLNGSAVTINAPSGTYTYSFLATASTSNNMLDKTAITSTTLSAAGQIMVTPSFTQT